MIFPKKKNKEKTTHNIEIGNLYDINKNLVEKNVNILTKEELNDKKDLIINFVNKNTNYYYMLLCNEQKDYTIFHINNICNENDYKNLANILIDECLINRGDTKSIELTESEDAIEIWLSIDKESYCYYFFPYDAAVIECSE